MSALFAAIVGNGWEDEEPATNPEAKPEEQAGSGSADAAPGDKPEEGSPEAVKTEAGDTAAPPSDKPEEGSTEVGSTEAAKTEAGGTVAAPSEKLEEGGTEAAAEVTADGAGATPSDKVDGGADVAATVTADAVATTQSNTVEEIPETPEKAGDPEKGDDKKTEKDEGADVIPETKEGMEAEKVKAEEVDKALVKEVVQETNLVDLLEEPTEEQKKVPTLASFDNTPTTTATPAAINQTEPIIMPPEMQATAPTTTMPPTEPQVKVETVILPPEPQPQAETIIMPTEPQPTEPQVKVESNFMPSEPQAKVDTLFLSSVSGKPPALEPAMMRPEPVGLLPKEEAAVTAPATPEQPRADPRQQFTGPAGGGSWLGGAGSATQAYFPLSTSGQYPTGLGAVEIHGVTESSGSLTTAGDAYRSSKFGIPPTPRTRCGTERQRLRDEFNKQEIAAQIIFSKYENRDGEGNQLLDKSAMKKLLQANASTIYVNKIGDGVEFILAVADENGDGKINQKEFLNGLMAWYAFNNMPAEVNLAMKKRDLYPDGSPMPNDEDLKELLQDINGFIDPDNDEVANVKRTAFAVGATESSINTEQMRMALSVWYLQVERRDASTRQLVEFSLEGWVKNLAFNARKVINNLPKVAHSLGSSSYDDLEQVLTENEYGRAAQDDDDLSGLRPFSENKCEHLPFTFLTLWLLLLILPGLFMVHVAGNFPTPELCEHDLAFLIQWKGYFFITLGFCGLLYQTVYDGHFRTMLLSCGLATTVVGSVHEFVGLGLVLGSDPDKCGSYLWNTNALFFVWILFWCPCLCCLFAGCCSSIFYVMEYKEVEQAEKNTQKKSWGRLAPPPSTRE